MEIDLSKIRREYSKSKLSIQRVDKNPMAQFQKWLQDAIDADLPEPTAFVLSTANTSGMPSSRVVLLKGIEDERFQFFTNYESRKGRELAGNPFAAMTFIWPYLERQVNVRGEVAQLSTEQSDKYFATRPWKARLGAWASKQSETLSSRTKLIKDFISLAVQYKGKRVPRPPHWGGYGLFPHEIEFWQGRKSRLHDRILFTRESSGNWEIRRLSP